MQFLCGINLVIVVFLGLEVDCLETRLCGNSVSLTEKNSNREKKADAWLTIVGRLMWRD